MDIDYTLPPEFNPSAMPSRPSDGISLWNRVILWGTAGTLLLSPVGCTPYERKIENELNGNPDKVAQIVSNSDLMTMKLAEAIPGFTSEETKQYLETCGINVGEPSTQSRRAGARRDITNSLALAPIRVKCQSVGKEAACTAYTGVGENGAQGTELARFRHGPRGAYMITVNTGNPSVKRALTEAVGANAYTQVERECKSKILKKQVGETVGRGLNGLKKFWNDTVDPALRDGVDFLKSKYSSVRECLDAGHTAEECARLQIQDRN